MGEVLQLAGYEYRKIFKRRSTWIVLALVLLWTLFSGLGGAIGDFYMEGEKVDTHYHMAKQERKALEHLEIQELNGQFFQNMQETQDAFYQREDGFFPTMRRKGAGQLIGTSIMKPMPLTKTFPCCLQ